MLRWEAAPHRGLVNFDRKEGPVSTAQKISVGFGIVYLAVGILGFIPGITTPSTQPGQGLLLGIFAVNTLHNIVHLAAGAILVWAGMSAGMVTQVNKVMAVVFAALVLVSFLAPIAEGVAINLPDTLLHLVSAAVTGYVGFMADRGARPATT
jgi:hypothetical protein